MSRTIPKKDVIRETRLFIGLNDGESFQQKFDTNKYIHILKGVCKHYSVPFSFVASEGGYLHDNGEYTQETSLVISLIDVDKETVDEMAKDLCAFFHQESVLITEELVRAYYVKERIE